MTKKKANGARVQLVERQGRLQAFNLPHDAYCAEVGECHCQRVVVRLAAQDKRTGERRVRPVERLTCASLTLAPHERSAWLPAAVLDCPEVRAAINAKPRRVTVTRK